MLQVQACEVAFQTGSEVQHPLLDRVGQCSAAPDQAASFFLQLLHPVPHERVKAIDHAWCASTMMSMLNEMGGAAQASAAAAEDEPRLKKSNSLRQRAARFLCCGGASPTLEADSHVSHDCSPAKAGSKSSKWWKVQPSKHRRQRSRDMAAYTDTSVHSQKGAVQADSCQEPAHSEFQGITFGESSQTGQRVNEELYQATAEPVQIAVTDDKTSLALPKQAAHVRAVSVTASASSAHEPQVQSLQQQHGVSSHSGCKDDKSELLEKHCSAGVEDDEQLVDGAPLPEELQEHMVDR